MSGGHHEEHGQGHQAQAGHDDDQKVAHDRDAEHAEPASGKEELRSRFHTMTVVVWVMVWVQEFWRPFLGHVFNLRAFAPPPRGMLRMISLAAKQARYFKSGLGNDCLPCWEPNAGRSKFLVSLCVSFVCGSLGPLPCPPRRRAIPLKRLVLQSKSRHPPHRPSKKERKVLRPQVYFVLLKPYTRPRHWKVGWLQRVLLVTIDRRDRR